jgi:hypothetical protein
LQENQFSKINSEAKMKEFLAEQEKASLLRQEEKDILQEQYRSSKEDREQARKFLLARVETENAEDLAKLQADIAHTQQLQALQYEKELIQKTTDNLAVAGEQQIQVAEHTERLRIIQRLTETNETQHKITLRTIEDDYAAKREWEKAKFDIWVQEQADRRDAEIRKRQLESLAAMQKMNLESDDADSRRRNAEKGLDHQHAEKLAELANDKEKAQLLAEKLANEKIEALRADAEKKLAAAKDQHAGAFAKSADDIKEIALALAGTRNSNGGQTTEKPKEKVVLICPKCKTRNLGKSKFCKECGEML